MSRLLSTVLAALCCCVTPAMAQDYESIGKGRLLTNDLIGDGHDRWRSGSYVVSRVYGKKDWQGARPQAFGDLLEMRIRGEIIQPAKLTSVDPDDRRYAAAWTLGLHSHFEAYGADVSLGGDLVLTGNNTGLPALQSIIHKGLGVDEASDSVLNAQIGDKLHVAASGELAQPFRFGNRHLLRPFAEARAGEETLVRVGVDYMFGTYGTQELLLRDVSSGQLYLGTDSGESGTTFVLGADIARVFESIYLPDEDAVELTDTRSRVRAGMHWQQGNAGFFYGLTYLGKEFETQEEEQLIGSLRINWEF
ncbi:MAG: lipid A-modifier LpxR family protein [Pseudoruegeria sp.]